MPANVSPNPNIALAPEDWFRATWRDLPPLPRPEPPPFDLMQGLARLARLKASEYGEITGWAQARVPLGCSLEEGLFWLRAIVAIACGSEPLQAGEQLASGAGARSPAELLRPPLALRCCLPSVIWLPLVSLVPAVRAVRMLCEMDRQLSDDGSFPGYYLQRHQLPKLAEGFRTYVRPYLDPEELQALRTELRALVRPAGAPIMADEPPLSLLVAASVGGIPELDALVAAAAPAQYPPEHVLDLLFGLPDATAVEEHVRRLQLRPKTTEDVRGWLAHTELSALDWVSEAALAQKRRPGAEPLARGLALVRAPEAAPHMLELVVRSQAPEVGRSWLERYPQHAAVGLVSAALGRGKVAAAAVELLRKLAQNGHAAVIEAALAATPGGDRLRTTLSGQHEEATPVLAPEQLPDWLRQAGFEASEWKPPKWLDPADLPPVRVDGKRLAVPQVRLVLRELQASTLEQPRPLIAALRRHAEPASLDLFSGRLCELWQQGGRPRKEMWALAAMGLLGGDRSALALGPLARTWREKLLRPEANMALDCLRAIGSDTALLQLSAITRIPRDWSMKEIAAQHLAEIARERGLTPEQLEERTVPHCGLDAGGSVLDYGPRSFRVVLGPGLKPLLRGADRKLTSSLPRPGAGDDPVLARAATESWKLLKKQLPEVAKRQTARLEAAMVHGRRWAPEEFRTLLVEHPVLRVLIEPLVWGCYDGSGYLAATFRLAEDDSLADAEDGPFALPASGVSLGFPHPVHLSEELRRAWGERMSDYELVPPFPQLGRPVFRPEPEEREARSLTRFNGVPCLAIALAEGLERRGWSRGDSEWGGHFMSAHRHFPQASLVAWVEFEPGIFVGGPRDSEPQTITGAQFRPCDRPNGTGLPLGHVDSVAFSEVAMDLAALTARR